MLYVRLVNGYDNLFLMFRPTKTERFSSSRSTGMRVSDIPGLVTVIPSANTLLILNKLKWQNETE